MTTRPLFADAPVSWLGEYVLLNVMVFPGVFSGLTVKDVSSRPTVLDARDTLTGVAAGCVNQGMPS